MQSGITMFFIIMCSISVINAAQDSNSNVEKQQLNSIFPKNLWIYQTKPAESLMEKMIIENIKHYATESQYEMRIVNYNSSKIFENGQQIQIFNKMYENNLRKDQQVFQSVIKNLLMLNILITQGGIFMDSSSILTQNLNWLQQISTNQYLNKEQNSQTNVFGFYSLHSSSNPTLKNSNSIGNNKNWVKYPALEDIFVASKPNTRFLYDFKAQYIRLIRQQHGFQLEEDPFSLVSVKILQAKDSQISKSSAVDYYGLHTINSLYFPNKILNKKKTYSFLAKMSLQQAELSMGVFRYLTRISLEQFDLKLKLAIAGEKQYFIQQDSFLGKYLLKDHQRYDIFVKKQQNNPNHHSLTWDKLPKIIWMYWDNGMKNAPPGNQLCFYNLKKYFEGKFEVRLVDDTNIHEYLSRQKIYNIDRVFKNSAFLLRPQHKSDLVRLELVIQYGGIYMDASYFFVEDVKWINQIASYSSELIFNRFGQLPQVLFFFHPIEGNPFRFEYSSKYKTKVAWHLAYENNFFAAVPDNLLLKQWYELFKEYLKMPYEDAMEHMIYCSTYEDRWVIDKNKRYLTAMDSLKSLLGCKQRQLIETGSIVRKANDYYKMWAINGLMGQQKYRIYTNYDQPSQQNYDKDFNFFMYFTSQGYAEGILGKTQKLSKLYGNSMTELNQFISKNYQNLSSCVHSESIFAKYLFNDSEMRLEKNKNGNIQVRHRSYDLHSSDSTPEEHDIQQN